MKRTFKISAGIIGDEKLANKAKWNEYGTSKIPPRPFVGHAADYINEERGGDGYSAEQYRQADGR